MDYDNTNRGVLFKNREKKQDNHPDYKGSINVDGQDFWISAWLKESKKGEKFMSLSVSEKGEFKQQMQKAESKTEKFYKANDDFDSPDFDDSIPF